MATRRHWIRWIQYTFFLSWAICISKVESSESIVRCTISTNIYCVRHQTSSFWSIDTRLNGGWIRDQPVIFAVETISTIFQSFCSEIKTSDSRMSAPKYRPKKKNVEKTRLKLKSASGWESVEFIAFRTIYLLPIRPFFVPFSLIQFHSNEKNSVELHLNWCINAKRPVLIWITTASIFTCDSLFLFLSLRCAFYASILHNSIYCYLHIFALRLSAWDAAEMQNLYCLWKLKWIAITVLMCLVCFELCAVPTDIPLFHCILSLILFSIIILANE